MWFFCSEFYNAEYLLSLWLVGLKRLIFYGRHAAPDQAAETRRMRAHIHELMEEIPVT